MSIILPPLVFVFQVLCRVVSSGMITDKRWLFDNFVADYSRFLEHHVVHIRKVGAREGVFRSVGLKSRIDSVHKRPRVLHKRRTNTALAGCRHRDGK